MSIDLTDGQYEVDGLVLGEGTPYRVTHFEDNGLAGRRTGDSPHAYDDGTAFGEDYLEGMVCNLEGLVETSAGGPSFDAVATMLRVWRGDAVRRSPGAVQVLRAKRAGAPVRRVYGRTRRCSPVRSRGTGVGLVPYVADFQGADDRWYADEATVEVLGIVPASTGGIVTSAVEAPLVNEITNPSFEVDLSGWTVGAEYAAEVVTDGAAVAGSNVAAVTAPADVATGGSILTGEWVTATPADRFSMGLWARRRNVTAPTQCRMLLLCYDGTTYLGPAATAYVSTTGGVMNEGRAENVEPLPGTTRVRVGIYRDGDWLAGGRVDFDAITLVRAPTLPGHFDGDTPATSHYSYSWQGTPHASPSVRIDRTGGIVSPITTAAATERPGIVTHDGDVPTWPVLTIRGPVTNPALEYVVDGARVWLLEFAGSLLEGQHVVVDCRPWARSVLRENGSNWSGKRTRRSTPLGFVTVPPGQGTILFRGSSAEGTAAAEVRFESAYAGN